MKADELFESDIFVNLMRMHISETLDLLLQEGLEFHILVNIEGVDFDPLPPQKVLKTFRPLIHFALANYTLQSAKIYENILEFEAGFGETNQGSLVTVELDKILQISVGDKVILKNASMPKDKDEQESTENTQDAMDKSMQAMLSNPENKKFLR